MKDLITRYYSQSLSGAFKAVPEARDEFDHALERVSAAVAELAGALKSGGLPLLKVPAYRDDLSPLRKTLEELLGGLDTPTDIVVFGTGGSSLGGQALAQLSGWNSPGYELTPTGKGQRLHFLDNLDAGAMTALLTGLQLKKTRFIFISKSGNTPETLMQFGATIDALNSAGLGGNLHRHILALTQPGADRDNTLRGLCHAHNIEILDHNPDIGGRYSVLTNVGVLPAMVSGLDPAALRDGAQSVVAPLEKGVMPADYAPAVGAAAQYAFAATGRNVTVIMPYAARLACFSKWFVQLWSESLGKSGKGSTPLAALGPVDQHSQLQLFLAGPADKFITMITTDAAGKGPAMPEVLEAHEKARYLSGKTVGDLVASQHKATAETLTGAGVPVRRIHVSGLNEHVLGALLMHFMIETILTGYLSGVDPFDQPAVEHGKILARQYLETPPAE